MGYLTGELILFHDSDGNVDETAIVLGNRMAVQCDSYYHSELRTKELIYKIHLTEDGRVLEYPEYYLKMRASNKKEYEDKYGFKK